MDLNEPIRYPNECGRWELLGPVRCELDDDFAKFCRRVAALSKTERQAIAASPIHVETSLSLIWFASRSAVLALRDGDQALLESGICGLGLASQHHDLRDVLATAAKLVYVAERLGVDPDHLHLLAQELIVQPSLRQGIETIVQRPREPGWQICDWGFREVETELGIGLIEGGGDYAPTIDLLGLAMRICRRIERDPGYLTTAIGIERTDACEFLPRAGLEIWAQPKPTDHPEMKNQRLHLRLMEFTSSEEALDISSQYHPSASEVGFSTAAGKLALRLSACRLDLGQPLVETDEAIGRFAGPLTSLLRNFPRYRWQRWQAWERDGCITLTPRESVEQLRRSGQIELDSKFLYEFSAATGEEASTIHYERQGWGPYRPLGDPVPCPHNCGSEYYPQGSGDCSVCGHLG